MENISQQDRQFSHESDSPTVIPWRMLILLSLLGLALVILALVRPLNHGASAHHYTYPYGVVTILYPLFLALLCLKDAFRLIRQARSSFRLSGRHFIPLLLSLCMLLVALSQSVLLFYHIAYGNREYSPLLSFILIFCTYPFLMTAILLLPAQEISPLARLRVVLDSLIIIVMVAILSAYFVLAPLLLEGSTPLAVKIIYVLFPAADLFLLFCLLLVALRTGEQNFYPVLIMLALSFLLIFLAHIYHLMEMFHGIFYIISPMLVLWVPALMLQALAAQTIKKILQKAAPITCPAEVPVEVSNSTHSLACWKSWLPPVVVLGISGLLALFWLGGIKIYPERGDIFAVGGFLVLVLIVVRQMLAIYEIKMLEKKLLRWNSALGLLHGLLEKQATTDPLTDLPNHRELRARLAEALETAQETNSTCALIFLDIDYFKSVNDFYGHAMGDAVLRQFSTLLTANICARASLGRWGGEEFVMVVPGMEPGEAFTRAEVLRTTIERAVFDDRQEVRLTCSLGVATYPYDAAGSEDLIMRADRAMYAAKRLGRNQTRVASEPLVLAIDMLAETPETAEEAKMLAVVESLVAALEARDQETCRHSRRVSALALKLALELGLRGSDASIVGMGGLLHDLGKIALPDVILFKKDRLNEVEWEYIARHPLLGEQILAPLSVLDRVAEIVRSHHERIDGSGYPDGLRGEAIPLGARIVAVADAYDAMIDHRPYRRDRTPAEAVSELRRLADRQFDPRVVEALAHLLDTAPRLSLAGIV